MTVRAKKDTDDLDPLGTRLHLLHGRAIIPSMGFPDRASFAAAWEQHRDALLPEWIREHPGTRPFAWWLVDHGKERPIVRPFLNDEGQRRFRAESFGFLHTRIVDRDGNEMQEPEAAYLDRHNLLTDDERRVLDLPVRR